MSLITKEISDFLSIQNYLNNSEINLKHQKSIEDIVLFLTLNSQFKNDCDMKEYVHLIGICPCISKCILMNIILELKLAEPYCNIIRKFQTKHFGDLVSEIIPTLRRQEPKSILTSSFIFLNYFHSVLATSTKSDLVSTVMLQRCYLMNAFLLGRYI